MSFTAVASRGENFNLNIFSHPPVKAPNHQNQSQPQSQSLQSQSLQSQNRQNNHHNQNATSLDPQYTQLFSYTKPQTPVSAPFSDDEDIFDLDMVTMDMDFEQAYSIYSQLQQKNALSEVEPLQKVQHVHQTHQSHAQNQHAHNQHAHQISQTQPRHQNQQNQGQSWPQAELSGGAAFDAGHKYMHRGAHVTRGSGPVPGSASFSGPVPGEHLGINSLGAGLGSGLGGNFENFGGGGLGEGLGLGIGDLGAVTISQPQPRRLHQSAPDVFHYDFAFSAKTSEAKPDFKSDLGAETDRDDSVEDADQFFSNTESDALQKFLDNLACPSQVNPFEFYGNSSQVKAGAKRNLETFKGNGSYVQDQKVSVSTLTPAASLTPPDSAAEEEPKKRRKTGKPLLSLEQKRLNHSHSEQKRRMLCKEAYERCLRLITNVDDYRNDLVSASSISSSKKKSKRRQLNKAGLPNLSKHSALMKIGAEIEKIQKKNDLLRSLMGNI